MEKSAVLRGLQKGEATIPFPDTVEARLQDLVLELLASDPARRPSAKELLLREEITVSSFSSVHLTQ